MGFGGGTGSGSNGIADSNDVALSNPVNNDVLAYDSSIAKWKNTVAGAGVDTSVFSRYVIVSSGSETRPGATGGLVIWVDMRADTSIQPAAMEPQDLRLVPDAPAVAPAIATLSLSLLTQGSAFSQTLNATGSPAPTWAVTAGTLPNGLSLSSSGVLSGTPSASGAYDFTVTATNTEGSDIQQYTGSVVAAGVIEHTVLDSNILSGSSLTSYTDGGTNSWMAQQFYITASPTRNWKAVGMRIYIPAGSSLIGQTGSIGLQRRASEDGGIYSSEGNVPMDMVGNGSITAFSAPLVAGWNNYYFSTEYLANSLDSLIVGYTLGGGYVFSSVGTANSVQAADGSNLYLAEASGGADAGRCYYCSDSTASNPGYGLVSMARWYGIDIIVRES